MTVRVVVPVILGVACCCALASLAYLNHMVEVRARAREAEATQWVVTRSADLDLDPETLDTSTLSRMLGEPRYVLRTSDRDYTEYSWYGGLDVIDAGCIALRVTAPFQGSVRGVRIGDPSRAAVAVGQQHGYRPEKVGNGGWWVLAVPGWCDREWDCIRWDAEWMAAWDQREGKIAALVLWNTSYHWEQRYVPVR